MSVRFVFRCVARSGREAHAGRPGNTVALTLARWTDPRQTVDGPQYQLRRRIIAASPGTPKASNHSGHKPKDATQ